MSPISKPVTSTKKRKAQEEATQKDASSKKSCSPVFQAQGISLVTPHEAVLSELSPRYNVLPASVISSTKIQKRVTSIASHILATCESERPPIGLLYARTADVCKLITIVEQCKRVFAEEGKPWYQYNQLFDLPLSEKKLKDVVEETVLEEAAEGSDSDDFEVMESRFEKAVLPSVSTRVAKSMRVFLSIRPVPDLKLKTGVTVQTSEKAKS
ncbi:hypothetical protein HJFPF1_03798 [Paramyrothecium foliicola]|nr:hypothetical protein HJFPF1_03798 [Paramyrothecium foliicola]